MHQLKENARLFDMNEDYKKHRDKILDDFDKALSPQIKEGKEEPKNEDFLKELYMQGLSN
jgi:hypothetical protein